MPFVPSKSSPMGNRILPNATRVSISDRGSIKAALKRDGVVILTNLPGDEHSTGYWENIAGDLPALCLGDTNLIPGEPPVACLHHESAHLEQLQRFLHLL